MREAKKYEKICIVFIILSCVRTLHTIIVEMSTMDGMKWGNGVNSTKLGFPVVFVCRLESQQEHVNSVAEGKKLSHGR